MVDLNQEPEHPFLQSHLYPHWSELQPEYITADLTHALAHAHQLIEQITLRPKTELSYENCIAALEKAHQVVSRPWGFVQHLNSVQNNPELRKVINEWLPNISDFYSSIFLNQALWQSILTFANGTAGKNLEGIYHRHLHETLADFRQNGAELSEQGKEQLFGLNRELAQWTQQFKDNTLDATSNWELILTDPAKLKGLPEHLQEAARQDALQRQLGTPEQPQWRFTLQAPSYIPLLTHLEDADIRKQVWHAGRSIGRAEPHNNIPVIETILTLRHQKSQLLGYANFPDLVLSRRMAGTGQNALHFVDELQQKIFPISTQELQELEAWKNRYVNTPNPTSIEPWDLMFWSEKMRQDLFSIDDDQLRPYFSLPTVLQGAFSLAKQLFGVTITPKTSSTDENIERWHSSVECYEVTDEDGSLLGAFYTDWFPREGKRSGAWMAALPGPKASSTDQIAPRVGVICGNITPPTQTAPALLTHAEARTVFHEFGHLMHHILGRVPVPSLNGCNVAWDFVELPSQIMENWCWDPTSLQGFARHYQNQERLPTPLLQRLQQAKNFQAGLRFMRQLSYGKMDLEMHLYTPAWLDGNFQEQLQKVLHNYMPQLASPDPTIVARFTHLFGNPTGYAAGYYSYKWAEVLDADAFSRFQAEGIFNRQTGHSFRQEILSKGNSEPPSVLFENFMGRRPDSSALLKKYDLLS